jgi:hypothetical protein
MAPEAPAGEAENLNPSVMLPERDGEVEVGERVTVLDPVSGALSD